MFLRMQAAAAGGIERYHAMASAQGARLNGVALEGSMMHPLQPDKGHLRLDEGRRRKRLTPVLHMALVRAKDRMLFFVNQRPW